MSGESLRERERGREEGKEKEEINNNRKRHRQRKIKINITIYTMKGIRRGRSGCTPGKPQASCIQFGAGGERTSYRPHLRRRRGWTLRLRRPDLGHHRRRRRRRRAFRGSSRRRCRRPLRTGRKRARRRRAAAPRAAARCPLGRRCTALGSPLALTSGSLEHALLNPRIPMRTAGHDDLYRKTEIRKATSCVCL